MTTSSASSEGRPGARDSIASSVVEVFCSAASRSSRSSRWVTTQVRIAGRRVAVLRNGNELVDGESGEGPCGGGAHSLVGVADEVAPQLDEVLGGQRQEALRGHEAQVARDPAAAKLLDEGVGEPRVRHERPSRSDRRARSPTSVFHEGGQVLAGDHDVLAHLAAAAEGKRGLVVHADGEPACVADGEHDLALGLQGLGLALREDAVDHGLAVGPDLDPAALLRGHGEDEARRAPAGAPAWSRGAGRHGPWAGPSAPPPPGSGSRWPPRDARSPRPGGAARGRPRPRPPRRRRARPAKATIWSPRRAAPLPALRLLAVVLPRSRRRPDRDRGPRRRRTASRTRAGRGHRAAPPPGLPRAPRGSAG